MNIALRGTYSATSLSGSQITAVVPAGVQVGDLMLVWQGSAAQQIATIGVPAGWNERPIRSATQGQARWLYRIATSADTSQPSYTFGTNGTGGNTLCMVVYSGVDTSAGTAGVVANTTDTNSGTSATAASMTTGYLGDAVVRAWFTRLPSGSSMALTIPDQVVSATSGGGPVSSAVGAQILGAAGTATGTKTATWSTTASWIEDALELKAVNSPPSTPAVTSPNGGEVLGSGATITWTTSTDPESGSGDFVRYEVAYTTDNGANWATIVSDYASTSVAWDTSGIASSTACRVRVRARDSVYNYSAWDESNANFTITHNRAPLAPTLTGPVNNSSIDRSVIQRLSWTFQDPDAGDSQSKYDLQYRVGASAWTVVTNVTPNTFWDAPAATFPAATYEWQVRTYDSQGVVGPYSASSFFTAASTPASPTITTPTSGAVISIPTAVIAWSAPTQTAYQARRVRDNAGVADTATVYWDSGQISSTAARNSAVTYETNNRYEWVQVRIQSSGLWSAWASVRVQISYTPPAVPSVTVSASATTASISVTYSQPTPTGTQPVVTYVDLYVNGVRRGKNLPATGTWTDYTPASGVTYTYRVVAVAANGTSTSSPETA